MPDIDALPQSSEADFLLGSKNGYSVAVPAGPLLAAAQSPVSGVSDVDPATWPYAYPVSLSSPPTFAPGVGDAASAIAGSVVVYPFAAGAMSFLGGPRPRGAYYPQYFGVRMGYYGDQTISSPTAVEFVLDTADATGRFEIQTPGTGGSYRVLVLQPSGLWGAVTDFTTRAVPSDAKNYLDLVTLGAAGVYTIRIEFLPDTRFTGLKIAATDSVSAYKSKKKYIVVGDSFTAGAFSESGSYTCFDGYVQRLAYITGLDVWASGLGGTGYVSTNNGAGVKFRDRLPVVLQNCKNVIFAGGINDTAADITVFRAEVAECFAMVIAAGGTVTAISPFWPRGITGRPVNILQYRDVVEEEVEKIGGEFIDVLDMGIPDFLAADASWAGALASTGASAATTVSVTSQPSYLGTIGAGPFGFHIKIGGGAAQFVSAVHGVTGSGPYTFTLAQALPQAFAAGTPVTLCGQASITGTGKQGATNGTGNADRYTGNDGTHPTRLGHHALARAIAKRWADKLTA